MGYILKKIENSNRYTVFDNVNMIVIEFEEHRFNDTQKCTQLFDVPNPDVLKLARAMRQMTDWLLENHKEIL